MKLLPTVCVACLAVGAVILVARPAWRGTDYRLQKVGETRDGQTLVATGQEIVSPSETLTFGQRPVDMVLSHDAKYAYVKETSGLTVVDLTKPAVASETPVKGGTSMFGLALSPDGKTLAFTDADNGLELFDVAGPSVTLRTTVKFPAASVGGSPYPCGVVLNPAATKAYVALSRSNAVAVVDLSSGQIESTYPVDVAPFGLALDASGRRLLVTCWSATPSPSATSTMSASGTPVEVDRRGIAVTGTLCAVDLASGAVSQRVQVGLQPTEVSVEGDQAYVTSSNADRVIRVDLNSFKTADLISLDRGLAGSQPTSLALAPDFVYAACGGRNSIVRRGRRGTKLEETRTPWYPIAVRLGGGRMVVACNKAFGPRQRAGIHPGWNSHDNQGSLTIFGRNAAWSPVRDDIEVNAASLDHASPVPLRSGDPSKIEHVVYIIKENRTYDQVLGDIGKGDSDPNLTIYGKEVTPNQHALANEFVLLDNYYCNGVLSADGHAWAMEGEATTYFERSFGGWTRSYPFGGDDPLAVSRAGFIWDDLLDHGKTVKDFGEADYASIDPPSSYKAVLQDFTSGAHKIHFKHQIAVERIRALSDPDYPGWNLGIPDVARADIFVRDLARMEREGKMPNFLIVYLPQDHTASSSPGMPTPRSNVADNDLAVGRVVEAISKSSFWPKTAIFVNEDDPQAGFDHVDGHRSLCLVVSPYARRHTIVSDFYNQTSVLRTIEHMLGVPPMNRFDASSPLMTGCFQEQPDLTPYTALANIVPLDEVNPPRKNAVAFRLDKPDMVNEDQFNRTLWAAAKGPNVPYPSWFAGSHGSGLAKRGLKLAPNVEKDDD